MPVKEMKNIFKLFGVAAGCIIGGMALQSCAVDEPFGSDGEGQLKMKLVINSDVTRAENDPADLSANCVVYISGAKGLLHKYQGLENLPESITLKAGQYVAEAWTGDSVTASFDKKFFRGYQPFEVTNGINQVVVNCKIANVVVSINPDKVDTSLLKDFNVKVENSRGSLDFTEDNYSYAKGYFMMPNNDNDLKVTISGVNAEGKSFSKEQKIEGVKRAHEYVLNFEYHPTFEEEGGSFVTIVVDDSEVLVEDEVEIFSAPALKGVGFELDRQLVGNANMFNDQIVKINAFGGIKNFIVSTPDYEAFGLPEESFDFKHCTSDILTEVTEAGLIRDESYNAERNLVLSYLTLSSKLLNSLTERDSEYVLTLSVTDNYGKTKVQDVRIAVGAGAVVIEDPVTVEPVNQSENYLAVRSRSAVINGSIIDASAGTPGIRYRESGTTEWTFVAAPAAAADRAGRRHLTPAQALRAAGVPFSVTLTGLKPGTRYEYQAVAGEFNGTSYYITTESEFVIPNASLEEWSNYSANSKVLLPGAGGERTFWDSGNHGSATMSVTLTQSSTDMVHSGSVSARLRSQFVGLGALGKFAAGNLFAGEYYKTNGTNGEIYFGREYDSSHPSGLKVYVNYRPKTADKNGSKGGKLKQGDLDKGQIYVALTTEKIHIDTRYTDPNNANFSLWNTDSPAVLAFGEKIFTEDYGADGQLQELVIPLDYKAIAKTQKPLYLVIVCTASYYGDYFDGGEGSCMYVDDFELVYE